MQVKTKKTKVYKHSCKGCGHTFYKDNPCDPEYCKNCDEICAKFETEELEIDLMSFKCPKCGKWIEGSVHLQLYITNVKKLAFATQITHYRHAHRCWDKNWGYNGHYYRRASHFGDYHAEKKKINNQIKRALMTKHKDFYLENGFTAMDFRLQDDELKTIKKANELYV
jgi:hypothetical protein